MVAVMSPGPAVSAGSGNGWPRWSRPCRRCPRRAGVDATLPHLVRAAVTLVDARDAAIGVLGAGGMLEDFVQLGIDERPGS